MDKETLIRLATPASIFLLSISIISAPIISRKVLIDLSSEMMKEINRKGTIFNPISIQCVHPTGNTYMCGEGRY